MWKNREDGYALSVIVMHWLTVVLLLLTYAAIWMHNQAWEGSAFRETMKHWHGVFGLSVLPLAFARIVLRVASGPAPPIAPPIDPWLRRGSRLFHVVLLVFLVVVPVLGWLRVSAQGVDIPFDLPPIATVDTSAAKRFKRVHTWLGEAGYYLIGIHTVATLAHHYVMGDNTLKRMLPERWFR